jgi:hypothetical protein
MTHSIGKASLGKFFVLLLVACAGAVSAQPFNHPGLLHSADELDFVRQKLAAIEQPWESAWEQLQSPDVASLDYAPKPFAKVVRGVRNNPDIGSSNMSNDGAAAYAHALQWSLTGNGAHAAKAIEILNAWANTLESVSGHDARLLAGMDGVAFCNAAELIRHSKAAWSGEDQTRFERMLRQVFYPVIKDFHPTANGNWDASMIQTMIAMGIFLDDRAMFDRAVKYYRHGEGNGAITKYFNEFGQCQESGRDQLHVQMGMGFLACACEMAWKQGVDLYGAADNRLAKGFEYTAKYNLGEDVPFERFRSVEGRYDYRTIANKGRGRFRPIFERIVHHYHDRLGLEMPYSRRVADKERPEGSHRQHMSWATLMAYRAPIAKSPRGADFYVAVNGSDSWSGRLSEPRGNDGPFATLARVRKAVRELKAQDGGKDIVVQIRAGQYRLRKTVVFGLEDSGGDSLITYEAFPGEEPVFSSDSELAGWKKPKGAVPHLPEAAQGKVWVAEVPKLNGAAWRFLTLYDTTGRLPRARSKGFIPVKSRRSSKNSFQFPVGAMRDWPNLEDVEVVVRPHHAWIANILPLTSVDMEKQIATTSIPATYGIDELHFLPGTDSVWVENVIDALDEPGEWVLDTKAGRLYLWPRVYGPPKRIAAPRLREFLRVEGRIDKDGLTDIPVRNLRFRGFTFTRGESCRVEADDQGLQHDWEMHDKDNALIRLRGAENCVIERCHFMNSGGGAIRVDLLGRNNKIENNHIEHIGATGILLCGYGPGTKDVNHHNLIFNNHIHHVGEIYPHAPGVMVWQSGDNRIANNLIHHTPYSGIIVSGVMTSFFSRNSNGRELVRTIRWNEVGRHHSRRPSLEKIRPFLHSHDNLVEYNEIHHAMEQLGDGNGIYIRGCGAGNVIRRNYIHHLLSTVALQSAIRTDGGQRDTLIAENLVYRCTSQGIQVKLNNRAVNNIIADIIEPIHKGEKRKAVYLKLREGPMTGAVIQRNILYHPGTTAVFYDQGRNPRLPPAFAKQADTDSNIYHCAVDPNLSGAVLNKNKRDGIDTHSRATDPLFIDPENGDFRFRPGSPALKMGIIPIDLSQIGLRSSGRMPKPAKAKE